MPETSQYFEIILLALVAVFIGLRLRAVLGTRNDDQEGPPRRPGPPPGMTPPPAAEPVSERVVPFPVSSTRPPEPVPDPDPADQSLDAMMLRLRRLDPGFDPEQFLRGAANAFEAILKGFAAGNEALLRTLLDDAVFGPFTAAIAARRSQGLVCETQIVRLDKPEITGLLIEGSLVRIMVRFRSEQIRLTRSADGVLLDGHPAQPVALVDRWVFARRLGSSDPSWLLVATQAGDA